VDMYWRARLAYVEGMSQRDAARRFSLSRESVRKMMAFSAPPGYRRKAAVKRPKLDGDREVHRKQRRTGKRVFERLRNERRFSGGDTIVKDSMREHERRGPPVDRTGDQIVGEQRTPVNVPKKSPTLASSFIWA